MAYWLAGIPALIDPALLMLRLVIGVMFTLSGYFKLTDPERKEKMAQSLQTGGFPKTLAMPLSLVELLGGLAMVLGLVTALAAFGLLALSTVALITVAIPKLEGSGIHKLENVLYAPEMLLVAGLVVLVATGAGEWSLDRVLF
ncbi:DoxX family protein [uncultured Devosia sp.]|uniref:DoxX family protein n=1 Tax=uncultured Devosia sp. TaxID=211434 RepID=UPI0035CC659B